VKEIFSIFTVVLPDYFLLNSGNTQTFRGEVFQNIMFKRERKIYDKQNIKAFFARNTGFIFILLYENYHISRVATATHELFIFISLDHYK
jgi:hypothetical protein